MCVCVRACVRARVRACVRACVRGFMCVAVVGVVVRLFLGGAGGGGGGRDISFFSGSRRHTNCDKKYGALLTIGMCQSWKLKRKRKRKKKEKK